MGGSTGILQPIPGGFWSPADVQRSIITISSSDSRRGTTNAVLRRSDRCLKHYYLVRPRADAIALLGVRGADRLPSRMLWDLRKIEKNCLDNDTRLYLMSVPTEKIVPCIEFKNVSRGSSLHLQSEARSGRYSCCA